MLTCVVAQGVDWWWTLLIALVCAGAGVAVSILLLGRRLKAREGQAKGLLEQADKKAEQAEKEARNKVRDELLAAREAHEAEVRDFRKEAAEREKRLEKREDTLDSKVALLDKKESAVEAGQRRVQEMQKGLEDRTAELDRKLADQMQELQRISRLTREEARLEVLKRVEEDVRAEATELARRRIERAKAEAEENARSIVLDSVHRLAADFVAESVVSSVDLPGDDMKGRIIGREGRNIRAFEKATGVDVIVDDTPGVVVVSGFDAVRREVARRAMEKLVRDGRIHPARIEDVVAKTEAEVQKDMDDAGRQVSHDLGIHDLGAKVVRLLGRLKYRTSYGQNCLQHSLEVAHAAGLLAEELKLDQKTAVRAGLLHDIGKALDHEMEGTHPQLGADLLRNTDERKEIVNAVEAHHEDVPVESLYAVIVQIADAISAARPGARRESLENYIKRLERLETIATGYPGIEKAYAIQAGRELRVLAKSDEADEAKCIELARSIAKQIEDELSYPGEVKVTLIRESRFVEYAR